MNSISDQIKIVNVPYHQQDYADFCGEAAAQMVLAGLSGQTLQQEDLKRGSGGGTLPAKLKSVLNEKKPQSCKVQFTINCDKLKTTGLQRILGVFLRNNPSGVPTLVHGGSHWIVVTGVQYQRDNSGNYTIVGFYINDPEPQTPWILYLKDHLNRAVSPPLPHGPGDACGTGKATGNATGNASEKASKNNNSMYGSSDTIVFIKQWNDSQWSTACNIKEESLQGFITVSGASLPLPLLAPEPRLPMRPASMDSLDSDKREAAAKEAAQKGIHDHRIDENGPLAERLAGYRVGDLTYHTELGTPQRHSYLIRLMREGEQIGNACVDADTLELLGVQAPASIMPTPDEMPELALRALTRYAAVLDDVLGPHTLDQRLFEVNPSLVWRPCRQSMSRYYPFLEVDVAGTILYVGLDGRVHRQLTPHDSK
jgi:hypothetical protein